MTADGQSAIFRHIPFRFDVQAVEEMFNAPDSTHRHTTWLIGDLLEGSIQRGQLIEVSNPHLVPNICRVQEVEVAGSRVNEVVTGHVGGQIRIGLWLPAPPTDLISLGEAVWPGPSRQLTGVEVLYKNPRLYLHARPDGNTCLDCGSWILLAPGGCSVLNDLTQRPEVGAAAYHVVRQIGSLIGWMAEKDPKGCERCGPPDRHFMSDEYLNKLGQDDSGWDTLYQCPNCATLWCLTERSYWAVSYEEATKRFPGLFRPKTRRQATGCLFAWLP